LKVSFHPARAFKNAPLKNEDAALFNKTFSILVCGQLARRRGKTTIVWEAAPATCAAVICFASDIGSTNVLEFEHHREVSSVSGEVILSHRGDATSICPITGQRSLPRNSHTRTAIDPPYGVSTLSRERYGFILLPSK
jgi:hypothetical protein